MAITAILAPGVLRLGLDYQVETFLRTDDPELKQAVAHYGEGFTRPDTLCLFGFETVDPLGEGALRTLRALTDELDHMTGVSGVVSVLSAPGLAHLSGEPRRVALDKSRTWRRLLVAFPGDDRRGALACLAVLQPGIDRGEFVRAVKAAAAELPHPDGAAKAPLLHLAGFPFLRETYVRLLKADQVLFVPLSAALTGAFLLLLLPGLGMSLATILIVPLTLVWTFGVLGYLGHSLVLLTATLPTLLMVIAVADAVHMAMRYREARAEGSQRDPAAKIALARTVFPCFLTSLTTVIGFGSLALADVPGLADLGLFAALGVLIAFVLTVTVVPVVLPILTRHLGEGMNSRIRWTSQLGGLARRLGSLPARPVLAVFGVVIVVCLVLASRVEQDSHVTEDLWPDTPIVQSLAWFEHRFVGPVAGEIMITPRSGDLVLPDNVAEVRELLAWVERRDDVIRTISFVDSLDDGLPVAMLGMLNKKPLPMISKDRQAARVIVFFRDLGAIATERYINDLRARAASLQHIDARPVGVQIVATRLVTGLVTEVFDSFLVAFCLISILMAIVFKSIRFGLIALVPNFLPLLITLGFMGAFGYRLRAVAVITFAIAFGLAVDNTIHIMTRFRRERGEQVDVETAVSRALEHVGTAVWTTSLLLLLGFSTLLFSGFRGSHDFGLFACITILAALAGDVLLLPALLRVFGGATSGANSAES